MCGHCYVLVWVYTVVSCPPLLLLQGRLLQCLGHKKSVTIHFDVVLVGELRVIHHICCKLAHSMTSPQDCSRGLETPRSEAPKQTSPDLPESCEEDGEAPPIKDQGISLWLSA